VCVCGGGDLAVDGGVSSRCECTPQQQKGDSAAPRRRPDRRRAHLAQLRPVPAGVQPVLEHRVAVLARVPARARLVLLHVGAGHCQVAEQARVPPPRLLAWFVWRMRACMRWLHQGLQRQMRAQARLIGASAAQNPACHSSRRKYQPLTRVCKGACGPVVRGAARAWQDLECILWWCWKRQAVMSDGGVDDGRHSLDPANYHPANQRCANHSTKRTIRNSSVANKSSEALGLDAGPCVWGRRRCDASVDGARGVQSEVGCGGRDSRKSENTPKQRMEGQTAAAGSIKVRWCLRGKRGCYKGWQQAPKTDCSRVRVCKIARGPAKPHIIDQHDP